MPNIEASSVPAVFSIFKYNLLNYSKLIHNYDSEVNITCNGCGMPLQYNYSFGILLEKACRFWPNCHPSSKPWFRTLVLL
jgi:hypothetical protein